LASGVFICRAAGSSGDSRRRTLIPAVGRRPLVTLFIGTPRLLLPLTLTLLLFTLPLPLRHPGRQLMRTTSQHPALPKQAQSI